MRVRLSSCALALLASSALACEGVPDLTFAGDPDGGTAPASAHVTDGSFAIDSAPGAPPISDATLPPNEDATASGVDDAPDDAPVIPLPSDAATPPPAPDGATPPVTGCPMHAPAGAICCGAVACVGNAQQCNCGLCGYCASEGYCCPSTHPAPGYCATAQKDCH